MNKSITQATQNDKQISKSIKRFFTRFHVSSALKASNAYKKKGIPVTEIFQYLFLLIFSNRSMYMSLITGRNTPGFAKDSVYRFMKMIQINWIRFTTILSSRIIKDAILPLDSKDRANVLIIDDSMFERNRSKKVELLAKVYDHAKHKYRLGFRMLTLGWSDGSTFLPVNSILLSTENKKNRINEAAKVDKRTIGYKRRKLSMEKGTSAMLTLLETAKKAAIPAKYVLFDSWFSSPSTLHAVKGIGYDVIGMVKKTPKMFFRYNGEDMSLVSIYNRNKKRQEDMIQELAKALNCNYRSICEPSLYATEDVMYALFELDEHYDMNLYEVANPDDPTEKHIAVGFDYSLLDDFLNTWKKKKDDLASGKITKEEYFEWKINWPHKND